MAAKRTNPSNKGRLTIHDVAAAAGVSKSTVSRILDERLPRSDSKTARRVRQAALELGYVRDISATSLRRGRTSTVGVLVPRLTNAIMAMIYEALARACQKVGQFAIVTTTDNDPEATMRAVATLLSRGVDGLVLANVRDSNMVTRELKLKGVPYVFAITTDRHGPASTGDDELGGYLVARHLLDLGHHKIGMIAGQAYASTAVDRQRGFRKAMAEAGIKVNERWIVTSGHESDDGMEAAAKLFSQAERPTAVFAVNDMLAIGAMSHLASVGMSVPDDVSIVGYNDIPTARHLLPPLTTVRVPFDQIAASAIELLNSSTAEDSDRTRIATPTLIPRRSAARYVEK